MSPARAMRTGEIAGTGVDGGDAVAAVDAGMDGMDEKAAMAGIGERTDTSVPAVRLSPRRGWSETITVRPRDMSRSFCRESRSPNTAAGAAAQSRSAA